MYLLRIEYPIGDFGSWKVAFDARAGLRDEAGVVRHRILRPTEDPNYVVVDLEFASQGEAEAYLAALRRTVYASREDPASVIAADPQARVFEESEVKEYRQTKSP